MKMSFDGSLITVNELPKVKADMKEFKARYTDGDLKCFGYRAISDKYEAITGNRFPYLGDVVKANVEAFCVDKDDITQFRVVLLLESFAEIVEMTYFTNLNLEVDTSANWNQFRNKYTYSFSIVRFERKVTDELMLETDIAV